MATQINSYNGGSVLPGTTVTTDLLKKLILRHTKPNDADPTDEEYDPLTGKTVDVQNLVFKKNGNTVGEYDPLNSQGLVINLDESTEVEYVRIGNGDEGHEKTRVTEILNAGHLPVIQYKNGSTDYLYGQLAYIDPSKYTFISVFGGAVYAIDIVADGDTQLTDLTPRVQGFNFVDFTDTDIETLPSPSRLLFKPENLTCYTCVNGASDTDWPKWAAFQNNDGVLEIEVPSSTDNLICIQFGGNNLNNIRVPSRGETPFKLSVYYDDNGTKKFLNWINRDASSEEGKLKSCAGYLISIVGGNYTVERLNAKNQVQYDEYAEAMKALKSRICYTIPLGSVGRIEKIALDGNAPDISCHATLFNPYMDIDLKNDANIVVNFGPSSNTPTRLLFAIYEFDRFASPPCFKWKANTDEINTAVQGIMHFDLLYKDLLDPTLYSEHLYILCVFGNINTLEIMGNQLDDNINMNAGSLALATAKQNVSGYTTAEQLGTDIPTLDLSSFSEAQAQSRVGPYKPVRVFASITNLTGLP